MKSWKLSIVAVAALIGLGLKTSPVRAGDDLAKFSLGTVARVKIQAGKDPHAHESVEEWHLSDPNDPDKYCKRQIQLEDRASGGKKRYVDVKGSWPNALQDLDFYVVNEGADLAYSMAVYDDGKCTETQTENPIYANSDFVFAFAIGQVKNCSCAPEKVSPHLLVYLPLATDAHSGSRREFDLRLFHMEKTEDACKDLVEPDKTQCVTLAKLRDYWQNNKKDEAGLKARMEQDIRAIMMFGTLDSGKLPPGLKAFAKGQAWGEFKYHNGVIHGPS